MGFEGAFIVYLDSDMFLNAVFYFHRICVWAVRGENINQGRRRVVHVNYGRFV